MFKFNRSIVNPNTRQGGGGFNKNKLINLKVLNYILLSVIILLGIFYLYGMNDISIKGYKIEELNKQKNDYASTNEDSELKIISLSSYGNIISRVNGLKMVAVKEIEYLSAATFVAKK